MMIRIADYVTCEYLDGRAIFIYRVTGSSFKDLRLWQQHVVDAMRTWDLTTPLLLIYDLTHRGVSIPYAVLNSYNLFNPGVTPEGRQETDRILQANPWFQLRLAIVVPESVSGEISKRLTSPPEARDNVAYKVFMDLNEAAAWLEAERKSLSTHRSENRVVDQLTKRESDILKLVAEGYSNQAIADTLTISVGTVKWHLQRIYRKLDVRTRTQAIVKARSITP
jgi:DNA-binding CsgD family transcriptional regulator